LSGGQRSRVALARLTLQGANFLLLDEPTNHLDLDTQEILEQVLKQFPGTVLLVTHDRWLAQSLATQVWRVDGDEMRAYKGNYEEYLKVRALEAEGALPGSNGDDAARERAQMEADRERALERERSKEERRQRKAAEKRAEQAAAMEARIHELEARLGQLSNQLEAASVAGDVTKVHRLGVEYQQTDAELHRAMSEWAELA
jgi:ATP-binding cassette subfamily F protein 3